MKRLTLLLILIAGCVRPAPRSSIEDDATVCEVLGLMRERLVLVKEVARWKWQAKRPITDPVRESAFLDRMSSESEKHGLDPSWTRAFFAAQIEAAKLIQQEYFRQWQAQPPIGQEEPLDLDRHLRPAIDRVSSELLANLGRAQPALLAAAARHIRELARREIVGEGITEAVVEVAVAPLCAKNDARQQP